MLQFDPETGLCVPVAALVMVYLTVFMDTLSSSISGPVLPFYALEFGVGTASIGYLYSAFNVAGFVGVPLLGRFSDKYGRRMVMIVSLVGAGFSALGQACAPLWGHDYAGFAVLLFFRALSGIWGAVLPATQVYVGDVSSTAVVADNMAKLSQVPSFSRTMGPGLGGGLSKFGLSMPILFDGLITLVTALLVYIYVPESPVWLASRTGDHSENLGTGKGTGKGQNARSVNSGAGGDRKLPWAVHGLGLSGIFFSAQMNSQISMMAVSARAKFQWDALHVGYMQMGMSLVQLATGIWISSRISAKIGLKNTSNLGGVAITIGCILMASNSLEIFLLGNALGKIGMGLRTATLGTVSVLISTPSNRGVVFSTIQLYQKVGATLGPIIAGHVAAEDPMHLIWQVGAFWSFISAVIMFFVHVDEVKAEPKDSLLRGYSDICDEALTDEIGSAQDYVDIGNFVGDLLTRKHYLWVSHKTQVYEMIDKLLPEVSTDGSKHKQDVERIIQHSETLLLL